MEDKCKVKSGESTGKITEEEATKRLRKIGGRDREENNFLLEIYKWHLATSANKVNI